MSKGFINPSAMFYQEESSQLHVTGKAELERQRKRVGGEEIGFSLVK